MAGEGIAFPFDRMREASTLVVRLVYLARLRETFGTPGESVALPASPTVTVEQVLGVLRARGGAFATELAPGRALRVAVNHEVARLDTPVFADAEVALFPPVTGG